MKIKLLLAAASCVLLWCAEAKAAKWSHNTPYGRHAQRRAQHIAWHGDYYHVAWGRPMALVVPPTAGMSTDWHWGVSGTRITPSYHQFARPWPGGYYSSGPGFQPTPRWPSDTNQFGVYYVRGPW